MSTQVNKGTAVVTGASSGIGAIYADRLAGQGYNLVLVARRADRLEELAGKLRSKYGRTVGVISADLSDDGDLRRVEQAIAADDSVTLLVNNAGFGGQQVVATADADAVERMIKVNVVALTRLTRAVLPDLIARNRGAIVNIASVLAFDTSFGGIYSGTKAYVVNFTEALQREVADSKVAVQVVLPGATRTEFWEVAGSDIANIPQEIVMTADDLVDAALVGLARGEPVTAPGLSDAAGLETYLGARQGFFGSLLAGKPAARYAA
ncbi:MAG: SDR family oxidoreductase [Mesorhizobium sp.]|nr:MAG: SDR family oxidoreductase [Mesorhizobium sp.]